MVAKVDFGTELKLAIQFLDELSELSRSSEIVLPPGAEDQAEVAVRQLSVAFAHGQAMLALFTWGSDVPAVTLSRTLFESFMRGVYFGQMSLDQAGAEDARRFANQKMTLAGGDVAKRLKAYRGKATWAPGIADGVRGAGTA